MEPDPNQADKLDDEYEGGYRDMPEAELEAIAPHLPLSPDEEELLQMVNEVCK